MEGKERRLRIGQRIRKATGTMEYDDDGVKRKKAQMRKGKVTDIYRYIFRVRWEEGGWYECFPLAAAERRRKKQYHTYYCTQEAERLYNERRRYDE